MADNLEIQIIDGERGIVAANRLREIVGGEVWAKTHESARAVLIHQLMIGSALIYFSDDHSIARVSPSGGDLSQFIEEVRRRRAEAAPAGGSSGTGNQGGGEAPYGGPRSGGRSAGMG